MSKPVAGLFIVVLCLSAFFAVTLRPASASPLSLVDSSEASVPSGTLPSLQTGTLDSAVDASLTLTSTSTFLPLVVRNHRVCSADSPFSLQIAALHQVVPDENGVAAVVPMTEAQWLAQYDEAFPTLVKALQDSGACWARVRINWSWIEPEAPLDGELPNYVWGPYHDEKLALVADTGVHLIATIDDVPDWAAGDPYQLTCSPIRPDRLDEFAQFLTDLVNRYKKRPWNIHHWELRNEADGTTPDRALVGQGCGGFSTTEYAQMLSVAYPAIKAADPQATVLLGGVAYDWFTEYGGPFNRYFPDGVMDSGGGDYIDAINLHYFEDYAAEWERWVPQGNPPTCGDVEDGIGTPYTAWGIDLIAKINHFRNRLSTCFGVSKPLWVTELAAHGYPDQPETLPQQARYVIQGYVRGLAAGAENITWFALVSPPYDTSEQGLLYQDLTPKPAYYAYQTLTRELNDYKYVRSLDVQNVEGYVFGDGSGSEKTVAWANGPVLEPSFLTFATVSQLRVVDRNGNVSYVQDGGAGDVDGKQNGSIRLQLPAPPEDPDPGSPPRFSAEPMFISR